MKPPSATYRLQLHRAFSFADVEPLLPYLRALGISHLYLSPIFASRPGSTHGYDVLDMNTIDPELGGDDGFHHLRRAMEREDLHWLQDIVPNHCAFHGSNRLLVDVLEKGRRSRYVRYFDIEWDHPYDNIRGRILAPFLGDFYARCLERGELALRYGPDGFAVAYYEMTFPIALRTYHRILGYRLGRLKARSDIPPQDLSRFLALVRFTERFDEEIQQNPAFDYAAFVKELLWELTTGHAWARGHVEEALRAFNGEGDGEGDRFDLMDRLLGEQFFRLSYWKVGTEELNYRRFFSINHLISLRMEDETVFEETHRLLFSLIEDGKIDGIRVDHVDGLFDPTTYLQRIRSRFPDLYLVVEKILAPEESLTRLWPVQGTTGYDFLDAVSGLLCDPDRADTLERCYEAFAQPGMRFATAVQANKRNIIARHMAGDIDNLALLLKGITNRSREGNDLTMYAVRAALVEILTAFPVYRTYVSAEHFEPEDRQVLARVLRASQEADPRFRNEIDLIGTAILQALETGSHVPLRDDWVLFVMRLQQYTGPLMAKGFEDTTLYQFNRLVARNEVGCDPRALGYSADAFHAFHRRRQASHPWSLNASSTHDTKRGEDVRARISVIAEDPQAWEQKVWHWHRLNRHHRTRLGWRDAPSRNDEYLLYQVILGTAPFADLRGDDFLERLGAYLIKACREAKQESSWLAPDEAYEQAFTRFAERILDPDLSRAFLDDFLPYFRRISFYGIFNSLAQTLLKITAPGIPDLYQGSELWALQFVDPDNRRPVDFGARMSMLEEIEAGLARHPAALVDALASHPEDGRIKLYLTLQALRLRREHPALFLEGSYEPLQASGKRAGNVIAFARRHEGLTAVVAVTRFPSQVQPVRSLRIDPERWEDTRLTLPPAGDRAGQWSEVLSGERLPIDSVLPVGELFRRLPVALLTAA